MSAVVLETVDSVRWAELDGAGVSEEPLPDLLRTMAGPDESAAIDAFHDVRWEILHQGTVYTATPAVVPFLVELVEAVGPVLRGVVVEFLGDLAHTYELDPDEDLRAEVRAAVTAEVDRLLPLLADDDPWLRYVAAYAVSGCPDRTADVLAVLGRRWQEEVDPRVRAALVMAAATLDRRTDLIKDGLGTRQPPVVRAAAVLAAVRTGRRWPGAKAVAAVRAAWRDGDPFANNDEGRWGPPDWYPEAMADLLDNLPPTDRPPILTALLHSADPGVRERALVHAGIAVGARRSLRESLPPLLVPTLTDPDPKVRLAAADAIRRAGRAVAPLADTLADLAGRDDEAAGQAVAALVELGDPRATDLVPRHLRAGTAAGDIGVALAAAGAPATDDLLAAVRHRLAALANGAEQRYRVTREFYQEFHISEISALLRLVRAWGPAAAPAIPELLALIRTKQAVLDATEALAAMGPAAADALPELPTFTPRFLDSGNNEFRLAVARVRWRLGGAAGPAVDEAWLHIARGGYAPGGIALLAEIGEPAHVLLPRMRRARDHWLTDAEHRGECVSVARLLWEWTGDPEQARPTTRVMLADIDMDLVPYDQFEAAILAVDLGEPDAVRTLVGMLGDRPFDQEMRAYRALWRRTGDPDPFLSYVRTRLADHQPPSTTNWPLILDLLTELGPAAAPLHPTLRSYAIRDEQVTTYSHGDTPGIADEHVRTAIQTIAGDGS
ncbi:HEAT repeat domain-containing protein [Actinophytocola sp.]|uniref:HEAT repeat domain-containing protein n=1 Tax=Actinophytocola sp. TaxID=1872138 RepID=UPI002D589AD8|nr:HEAT repeat domain-containing protein [Actinophytocola sp.]HYQ66084.1 HEAT repeat domain-containing protein [Actinophytocola sp.]